jgi:hypothetical protein
MKVGGVIRRLRRERHARKKCADLRANLDVRLRALDGSWVIVRDREIEGAPAPVTIAAGPTGIWVLWVPDPLRTGYHPGPIAESIASCVGVAPDEVRLRALYSETAIVHVVDAMVSSAACFSSHHAIQWAQRLAAMTGGAG